VNKIDLRFSGNIGGVLNLVSGIISNTFKTQISEQVCGQLVSTINTDLSPLFNKFGTTINELAAKAEELANGKYDFLASSTCGPFASASQAIFYSWCPVCDY
jgi:membrane protease subunit (stomatin/prohibitin family)